MLRRNSLLFLLVIATSLAGALVFAHRQSAASANFRSTTPKSEGQNFITQRISGPDRYIRAGALRPELHRALIAIGDRLSTPGGERPTLTGTLTQSARSLRTSVTVRNTHEAPAENPTSSGREAQPTIALVESELITVTPRGFEPQRIMRTPGPFLLIVQNRSGLETVNVRLNLVDVLQTQLVPPNLFEVTKPREQPDWSGLQSLSIGNYVLREATHPGWACYITIAAP